MQEQLELHLLVFANDSQIALAHAFYFNACIISVHPLWLPVFFRLLGGVESAA